MTYAPPTLFAPFAGQGVRAPEDFRRHVDNHQTLDMYVALVVVSLLVVIECPMCSFSKQETALHAIVLQLSSLQGSMPAPPLWPGGLGPDPEYRDGGLGGSGC